MTVACAAAVPAVSLVAPSWEVPAPAPSAPRATGASTASVAAVEVAEADVAPRQPVADRPARLAWPALGDVARGLAWLWAAGALLALGVLGAGLLHLARLARAAAPVREGRWRAEADAVAARLGIDRPIELLQSEHDSLLVTWGLWRPRVILPAPARSWSTERVRIVLGHELAHVARADWAALLAAQAVRAVYWFNPLAWIAARRLRDEGERACDDAVLGLGVSAPDYAAHLLDLTRTLGRRAWMPAPAMARRSGLERRVAAMLSHTHRRGSVSSRARLASACALLLVTAAVASYGVSAQSAGVSGTVFDATNRVVPEVEVRLANPATGAEYEAKTGSAGQFDLQVPAGDYVLTITRPGFVTIERSLTLTARLVLEPVLDLGTLEETITVTDDGGDTSPRAARRTVDPPAAPTCGNATTGGVIAPPLKLVDAAPAYPSSERGTQQVVDVELDATIGRDGFVSDAAVVSATSDAFADAAVAAVRRWQFTPTYLNCQPVDVSMIVRVRFAPQ
jgi:TonB family protein